MTDIKISKISDIKPYNSGKYLFNCGILRLEKILDNYIYLSGEPDTELVRFMSDCSDRLSIDELFQLTNYIIRNNTIFYRFPLDSECTFYNENNEPINPDIIRRHSKISAIIQYDTEADSSWRFTVLQLKSQTSVRLDCLLVSPSSESDISDCENGESFIYI